MEEAIRKLERFCAESRRLDSETMTVGPGSLVQVRDDHGVSQFYLLLPAGGGMMLDLDGNPLLVVNLSTPMARALMGRSQGSGVTFDANTARPRRLVIVNVS